jgi:hypothetical protein
MYGSGVLCLVLLLWSRVQRSTFNIQRSTFNIQRSTFNIQHSEFNVQHSTFNTQHSTFNIQHSTFNIQHSTFNIFKFSHVLNVFTTLSDLYHLMAPPMCHRRRMVSFYCSLFSFFTNFLFYNSNTAFHFHYHHHSYNEILPHLMAPHIHHDASTTTFVSFFIVSFSFG